MDMIRQRLGLSLYFYSRIDGALFCVFTFCRWSLRCLECCCFVGDLITMKNETSFARKNLHGCFCSIAIDERILQIRLQMVRRLSKWILKASLHFKEGTSSFLLFLKNRLQELEIGSFFRKCLMLFLWEECPRRGFRWLCLWSLISITQIFKTLHNGIFS